MKLALVLALILMSASSFAAITVRCANGPVQIQLQYDDPNHAHLIVVGVPGSSDGEFELQLDKYSSHSSGDLFSSADISDVQSHFNGAVVFRMPHLSKSHLGDRFTADLQLRDYDDGYTADQYHFDDRGPGKNGYALQSGSVSDLTCQRSE